jgi:chromosome segregation ATPase
MPLTDSHVLDAQRAKVATRSTKLDRAQKELNAAEAQLKELEALVRTTAQEILELREPAENKEAEAKNAEAALSDSLGKIHRIEQDLQAATAQRKVLTKQDSARKHNNLILKEGSAYSNGAERREAIATMRTVLAELKQELPELEETASALRAEADALRQELDAKVSSLMHGGDFERRISAAEKLLGNPEKNQRGLRTLVAWRTTRLASEEAKLSKLEEEQPAQATPGYGANATG